MPEPHERTVTNSEMLNLLGEVDGITLEISHFGVLTMSIEIFGQRVDLFKVDTSNYQIQKLSRLDICHAVTNHFDRSYFDELMKRYQR